MTRAISGPTAASLFLLSMIAPAAAAIPSTGLGDVGAASGPRTVPAQYDATPGAHHGRRNRGGEVKKSIEPSHADLHGATRESADKAYRKQYGF